MVRLLRVCLACGIVGTLWFCDATASMAQVLRYEPARPTVSPYLNLFREEIGVLPNYHSLVRPLQYQNEFNQSQRRFNQQQTQTIRQLQGNVRILERQQSVGQLVAPTGRGSWFARPSSRSTFGNTSRFYSQSGGGQRR